MIYSYEVRYVDNKNTTIYQKGVIAGLSCGENLEIVSHKNELWIEICLNLYQNLELDM